jgi:hypothetical protein
MIVECIIASSGIYAVVDPFILGLKYVCNEVRERGQRICSVAKGGCIE